MSRLPTEHEKTSVEELAAAAVAKRVSEHEAVATDEELLRVAQSPHGIEALPENDRERVLRAIALNQSGAQAVFDLAEIDEDDLVSFVDEEASVGGPYAFVRRVAIPAWGLAASLAVVSAVAWFVAGGASSGGKVLPGDRLATSGDGGLNTVPHGGVHWGWMLAGSLLVFVAFSPLAFKQLTKRFLRS